ncbi:hypothetical protein ACO1O0_001957 [Amphichorda felina]
MKVTGALVALAAVAPMASAIPFRMADFLAPMARAPAPAAEPAPAPIPPPPAPIEHPVFPQMPTNLTARSVNDTEPTFSKRAFIPQGSEDHAKRSFHNGIEGLNRRTNLTFKA